MINKLISKTQVRLLEYDGNPSQDYKDGYCRAIHDVLELDTIPTLGADEYEKFKAEYETRLKADMVAILDEFDLRLYEQYEDTDLIKVKYVRQAIQQKISELKEVHNNDEKT